MLCNHMKLTHKFLKDKIRNFLFRPYQILIVHFLIWRVPQHRSQWCRTNIPRFNKTQRSNIVLISTAKNQWSFTSWNSQLHNQWLKWNLVLCIVKMIDLVQHARYFCEIMVLDFAHNQLQRGRKQKQSDN